VNTDLPTTDGARERRPHGPRRRASTLLAAAVLVLLFAPLAWFLLDRPDELLPAYPFTEDAFYYFAVADHFSRGQIDVGAQGEYENGFQPLQAVLLTPVMLAARLTAGGDYHYAALRWFAVAHLALLVAVLVAVIWLVRRLSQAVSPEGRDPPLWPSVALGGGLVLVNPRLVEGLLNGQETALLVLGVLVLLGLLLARRPYRGETVLLPVVCGLVVLARIDAVVLAVGALIVWEVMRRRRSALLLLHDWGLFALTCGWWFVLNLVKTGSPLQSSGGALMRGTVPVDVTGNLHVAFDVAARLTAVEAAVRIAASRVTRALGSNLELDPDRLATLDAVVAVGYWSAVALALWWLYRRARGDRPLRRLLPLAPFAVYCLALCAFYVWLFAAWWFLGRYLAPIEALATVAEATLAVVLLERALATSTGWRLAAAVAAVVVALPLAGRYVSDLGLLRQPRQIPTYARHYTLVRDLPPDARVASFQSGVLSYFRPATINLDGKMNRDALAAVRSHSVLDYLLDRQIEYVIEWQPVSDRYLTAAFAQRFEVVASIGDTKLWRRKD
jgi:CDP-diglyceride synthetase